MASNIKPLAPIPQPRVLFVDTKTGLISEIWYLYLKRADEHIREIERRLDALEP